LKMTRSCTGVTYLPSGPETVIGGEREKGINASLKGSSSCVGEAAQARASEARRVLTLLTACTVGPNYIRPATEIPWAYREMEGWR